MKFVIALIALALVSFALAQDCGCPSSDTCCDIGNGEYGCCPYTNGVCCADHQHCCPNGYSCDSQQGECVKRMNAFPGLASQRTKMGKKPVTIKPKALDCGCPQGETCCDIGNGEYGCCPYQNAICCQDHSHCCPAGYTCDIQTQECVRGSMLMHKLNRM